MKNLLRIIAFLGLFLIPFSSSLFAQTNGNNNLQPEVEVVTDYQTAIAVWTEAQPHFWPGLRMTLNDLLIAYFRNGEGEIEKLGTLQYRAEMRGCFVIVIIADD